MDYLIKGDLVFTTTYDTITALEDHVLHIREGRIFKLYREIPAEYSNLPLENHTGRLIIPGFTDLHLHAVQFVNRGLGLDKELLDWLNVYTFPEEANFKDLEYADGVFKSLIKALWSCGTLHSAVYSSLHREATGHLLELFIQSGLNAYVGKVNMDRNSGPALTETAEASLEATRELIDKYGGRSDLVKPIITPRFAPSCTPELLTGLGDLAREYGLPVQSHLNETPSEIKWVKRLFPDSANYLHAYRSHGLVIPHRTIMAHCVYNQPEEVAAFAAESIFLAHCPTSNLNLASGIMEAAKLLRTGSIKLGLGSDIAAGDSLFIPAVMRSAIQSSKLLKFLGKATAPLTLAEAFYLGTKGGGEFFGPTGSFEEGYWADLLVLEDSANTAFRPLSPIERLEKIIYTGDDRNILIRKIRGATVPCPFE